MGFAAGRSAAHLGAAEQHQVESGRAGAGRIDADRVGAEDFLYTAIETDRQEEQPPAENAERAGVNPFRIERPTHYYRFVVLCYDRGTGQLLWQQTATEQVPHEGHHKDHGYASPSPVTDGELLYTSFGSRGIYCWDLDGKLRWKRDLGLLRMYRFFGEASTPALAGGVLFVVWDHEGDSALYALDAKTGETRLEGRTRAAFELDDAAGGRRRRTQASRGQLERQGPRL